MATFKENHRGIDNSETSARSPLKSPRGVVRPVTAIRCTSLSGSEGGYECTLKHNGSPIGEGRMDVRTLENTITDELFIDDSVDMDSSGIALNSDEFFWNFAEGAECTIDENPFGDTFHCHQIDTKFR